MMHTGVKCKESVILTQSVDVDWWILLNVRSLCNDNTWETIRNFNTTRRYRDVSYLRYQLRRNIALTLDLLLCALSLSVQSSWPPKILCLAILCFAIGLTIWEGKTRFCRGVLTVISLFTDCNSMWTIIQRVVTRVNSFDKKWTVCKTVQSSVSKIHHCFTTKSQDWYPRNLFIKMLKDCVSFLIWRRCIA